MKHQPRSRLEQELKAAGASTSEVHELSTVASSLKQLQHASPMSAQPGWRHGLVRMFMPFVLTSCSGLALGMALVIFSQTVLPGSWLYPVQALSDNVAVTIDSNYRGTVMMKRAEQVKQLIAEHADSKVVLATLADYSNQAILYKSASTNYAAFEYCKTNLQQAAASAPNPERQAIVGTLSSLRSV